MHGSMPGRLVALGFDAEVVLAFGVVWIDADHGAGPIGLLMFSGNPDAWCLAKALGWVGIVLLPASVLLSRCRSLCLSLMPGGLGLLVTSWFLLVRESRTLAFSLVCSIPFLALALGRLMYLSLWLCGAWAPGEEEGREGRNV